jgi:signal transduction histidine kinase
MIGAPNVETETDLPNRSPLRVVIVEDSEMDAKLILRHLRQGGYEPHWQRVETLAALGASLAGAAEWDIIISDYHLPQFTGLDALKLVRSCGGDIPFILVSGAIGEEHAVAVIKAGANDFLLKSRLPQLALTVQRELESAENRRQRKRAEVALAQAKMDLERQNQGLEQCVTERTAKLQQAFAEMERFTYVASHDLQEPLRTVSSFAQLLARRCQGKLDAEENEFIGFIVDGASRMQKLINDLLALSRIGTRGNPFSSCACEEVLKLVTGDLAVSIAESGAVITHDPLPTLMADQTQLAQLFQNLLSNAIKFRRPEATPRIHLSARQQDGEWRLSVRDNGMGIEPRFFVRIFIVFQRLHTRDEYPGTGIGLAICKKIVERHGGNLWVESQPGNGSTFHFTIPDGNKPL